MASKGFRPRPKWSSIPRVGEGRTGRQSGHRVTVDEAARHLGLTVDAVRKRVQRGQIAHEKDEAGRVRIILDEYETVQDESPDNAGQAIGAQGELEEEREARTEERRRHDTLMAQLMQRIPELEGPSETRESPRTGEERQEKAAAESRSATGEAQEGVQRPWWRRMFGS